MRVPAISRLQLSPATLVAILVLVFATSGVALGAGRVDKSEVNLVTFAGSADTTGPHVQETILLNGQPSYTFTQLAGEAVQLIASVDAIPNPATFCGVTTIVYGTTTDGADDGSEPDLLPLGTRVDLHSNKGELGEGSDVGGIAAPAADRSVTLQAITRETDMCDADPPHEEVDADDTWNVSLSLTLLILRN